MQPPQDKNLGLLCLSFADLCIFPKYNGNKGDEWFMFTLLFWAKDCTKNEVSHLGFPQLSAGLFTFTEEILKGTLTDI